MAENVKKKISLINVFAPGFKKFKDFLNGRESGVIDAKAVEEYENFIKAIENGQYEKGDIVAGNEYIRDLQDVPDRASSNGGGRKKQVKQIDEQDNERA